MSKNILPDDYTDKQVNDSDFEAPHHHKKRFSPRDAVRMAEEKATQVVRERVVPRILQEKKKVPKPTEPFKCLNCGVIHQERYCPECGQRSDVSRFDWKQVLENITKGLFNTDRGFLFTIKVLFIRPGEAIIDYINGKRVRYFPPFPSMFIIAAFYALINKIDKLSHPSTKVNIANVDSVATVQPDKVVTLSDISGNPFFDVVRGVVQNNFGLLILLATPIFVFSLRTCYGKFFRKQYNWAESFIMSGFMNAQFFLVLAILTLISLIFPGFEDRANSLSVMFFVGLLAWDMYPISKLTKKRSSVWRSIYTYLLFFFILLILVIIVVIAVVLLYVLITGDDKLNLRGAF